LSENEDSSGLIGPAAVWNLGVINSPARKSPSVREGMKGGTYPGGPPLGQGSA